MSKKKEPEIRKFTKTEFANIKHHIENYFNTSLSNNYTRELIDFAQNALLEENRPIEKIEYLNQISQLDRNTELDLKQKKYLSTLKSSFEARNQKQKALRNTAKLYQKKKPKEELLTIEEERQMDKDKMDKDKMDEDKMDEKVIVKLSDKRKRETDTKKQIDSIVRSMKSKDNTKTYSTLLEQLNDEYSEYIEQKKQGNILFKELDDEAKNKWINKRQKKFINDKLKYYQDINKEDELKEEQELEKEKKSVANAKNSAQQDKQHKQNDLEDSDSKDDIKEQSIESVNKSTKQKLLGDVKYLVTEYQTNKDYKITSDKKFQKAVNFIKIVIDENLVPTQNKKEKITSEKAANHVVMNIVINSITDDKEVMNSINNNLDLLGFKMKKKDADLDKKEDNEVSDSPRSKAKKPKMKPLETINKGKEAKTTKGDLPPFR